MGGLKPSNSYTSFSQALNDKHSMNTKDTLTAQLLNLGLKANDIIMLHASMRAIGRVESPDSITQAIMEAIRPDGTLMMYVGCESKYEAVGRGKISASEERIILEQCPAFDPDTAIARPDYGILAECFRCSPGVTCSSNPGARMAALGAKARWLIANHSLNYGYGAESPLAKLYESGGKLLLLGSDLDQVTILHYAEHIAPIQNKRIARFKVPLLQNGSREWVDVEEYDTSIGIRRWPEQFFATILDSYLKEHHVYPEKVGKADSYLIDVKSLVDLAVQIFVKAAESYSC